MKNDWKIDNSEFASSGFGKLSQHEDDTIRLFTLAEAQMLKINKPENIVICIDGQEFFAKDMDEDTRFGYVAYGYLIKE